MFKALAIHLNMFRVCYGSQVNMATTDIVVLTHLSKSPARLQTSIWLSSQSKGVDALLFKLNYIVLHIITPSRTKDVKTPNFPLWSHTTSCHGSWLKEHCNNLLAQYLCRMPHKVGYLSIISNCTTTPQVLAVCFLAEIFLAVFVGTAFCLAFCFSE